MIGGTRYWEFSFVVLRYCKDDLRHMLDTLYSNVQTFYKTWSPSSIIVDNAQAIINTLRYVPLCYAFCNMHTLSCTSCHAFSIIHTVSCIICFAVCII